MCNVLIIVINEYSAVRIRAAVTSHAAAAAAAAEEEEEEDIFIVMEPAPYRRSL